MQKSYRLCEVNTEDGRSREALAGYPEIMRDLLLARDIETYDEAEKFLAPDFERDSHDPFLLPDMEKAVERIIAAVRASEQICVWSDYDCDGIPGGVMLVEFLRSIGAQVRHYIPHRHNEGYGLNIEGIDEIASGGVTLMITVDLGITDLEAVAYARERGIEVIITDHHLPVLRNLGEEGPGEVLPEALAVVDAHRTDSQYPFKELCGAGVAWKLVQAILSRDRFGMKEGQEKWLLDLVGLATLSDMVPLVGENRMLARFGLLVMRKNRRPGLRALFALMKMRAQTLTEDDIVFMVTPRINAASRMDSPQIAAELLGAQDDAQARAYAERLQHLNDERKGTVASIVKEARKRLREREMDTTVSSQKSTQMLGAQASAREAYSTYDERDDAQRNNADGNFSASGKKLVVIGDPSWRPGVLGLVANALVESEGVPAFVWGRHGDAEALKGSCRSDGSINVVDLMRAAGDVFLDVGGHAQSGGFSLAVERAHELAPALITAHAQLSSSSAAECFIDIDRTLGVRDARTAFAALEKLSPFGVGNQKPLFKFNALSVSYIKTFGKQSDHLEIGFIQEGASIVGISFFSTADSFARAPKVGMPVDIVAHVEKDFRGQPRLRIIDIL